MKNSDFCVIILSFWRSDNVQTYKYLREYGYTWKIYILCSDDDKQLEDYKRIYGDEVLVFNKDEVFKKIDTVDNFFSKWSPIYARNIIWDFVEKLGYRYFIMADDDYNEFAYRIPAGNVLKYIKIKNCDKIFLKYFEYLDKTPQIEALAFGQWGDYIWWVWNSMCRNPKRKLMNLYFLDTKRRFEFKGTLNDDVNTYLYHWNRGKVFLTPQVCMIHQAETQKQWWGITELYLEAWTYAKSFYSVIINPTCVKIATVWERHKRIHHKIISNKAYPLILSEECKKA